MMKPIEIKRLATEGVEIEWSDGHTSRVNSETLRKNCPCATCREARGDSSHGAPLTPSKPSLLKVIQHSKTEELALEKIWPIGNYAIGIEWGDGHTTGIYTYELLRELTVNC